MIGSLDVTLPKIELENNAPTHCAIVCDNGARNFIVYTNQQKICAV